MDSPAETDGLRMLRAVSVSARESARAAMEARGEAASSWTGGVGYCHLLGVGQHSGVIENKEGYFTRGGWKWGVVNAWIT